jgi:hypothetical protein
MRLPDGGNARIDDRKVKGYTPFGRKYTVIGTLTGPIGVVQVATVWLEEPV